MIFCNSGVKKLGNISLLHYGVNKGEISMHIYLLSPQTG